MTVGSTPTLPRRHSDGREQYSVSKISASTIALHGRHPYGETGIEPHTISLVLNHISIRRGTITGKVYNQYGYDREKREALDARGSATQRIVAGQTGANITPMRTLRSE